MTSGNHDQQPLNAWLRSLPILNSFKHIACAWLISNAHIIRNITHQKISRLELPVFPVNVDRGSLKLNSRIFFAWQGRYLTNWKARTASMLRLSSVFSYAITRSHTDY